MTEVGEIGLGHHADRALDHLRFDDAPQVVDIVQLVERDAGGDGAALGDVDDEPLGLEPVDRLANRDVRHAEVLLQLAHVDPPARLDRAEENPLA